MNYWKIRGLSISLIAILAIFTFSCDAIEQAESYKETYDELDSLGLGLDKLKEVDLNEIDSLNDKLKEVMESADFEDEEFLNGLDSIKGTYGLDSIDNKELMESAKKMMENSDSILDFLKKMQGK